MKLFLVVGSLSSGFCGVVDYTSRLFNALRTTGINIEIKVLSDIKIKALISQTALIHIQYPSKGYGITLLPQVYSIFLSVLLRSMSLVRLQYLGVC